MLKSCKSNYSTKRKAKNSTAKTKKNNLGKSQHIKNTKVTKAKDVQQNTKSSHLKDTCVTSTFQLRSQSESSSGIQPSNALHQKSTEINLVQNKNNILEINNSYVQLPALDGGPHLNSKEFSMKRSPDELFNLIYTGQITLTLPNRSWSIHYAEIPIHCIVVSEISLHHDSGSGFVPLYTKQIIFYEKMYYDIFLFNSKASGQNLSPIMESIADVMNIIAYTNNLKLCSGGPEVSLYNNVNLECAYRDNKEKWRHNLCSLEVSEGKRKRTSQ
ncbi:hypothetical protein KPH14_003635 [Odynerus spinipes]|uniref:Uncharacterized protein n=1 Tax=Odynerus spinipes TaxID=1348599 RepID=A0AAD9R9U2_9HYME|nr:hypothetical protein KPH14_003635 [Odynerus spinipes]